MGVIFKQSSLTTGISYIGAVIGYFNVLWLFPAVLEPEQIGLLRLLPSMAFLLLPFTQLGLSQSVLKFYPSFKDRHGGQEALFTLMMIANLTGFGVTLIFLKIFQVQVAQFFEAKSPLANQYIHVTIVLILLLSYQTIFESFSRSILKIVFPGMIKDILIRLMYTLLVGSYFLKWLSFNQVVNGLIGIYLLALLLLLSYILTKGAVGINFNVSTLKRQDIRQIANYSFFTLLGTSGNYIILNIDQLMISKLVGLAGNGIYTTAFFIAIVIEMPRRSIANIATPMVSQLFNNHQEKEVDKLYKQVSINQMIIGLLILLGILLNIENIFSLIPNNEIYQAGISVVFIIGLTKILDMSFSMNSEIILMSDYYRYNVMFTLILAIVAVITNWFFIQLYGITGAAIATAITISIFNLTKLIFIKIKLNLWPFTFSSLKVLMIGGIVYLAISHIPPIGGIYVDLILRSALISIAFILPIFLINASPEMNGLINGVLRRLSH